MSVQELISKCKHRNGYPVTLRGCIPGRGKNATECRAALKRAFDNCGDKDGVEWDKQRGVFVAERSIEAAA